MTPIIAGLLWALFVSHNAGKSLCDQGKEIGCQASYYSAPAKAEKAEGK